MPPVCSRESGEQCGCVGWPEKSPDRRKRQVSNVGAYNVNMDIFYECRLNYYIILIFSLIRHHNFFFHALECALLHQRLRQMFFVNNINCSSVMLFHSITSKRSTQKVFIVDIRKTQNSLGCHDKRY